MEQKYVTFQLHKNFEKKRVKKGTINFLIKNAKKIKISNFIFDQKIYSTLFLPFFFKIFVELKRNTLVLHFHIYNIKNG